MSRLLCMGAFDSEHFLRDENLSKLPATFDKERTNIVLAMDSLLFPFCSKEDILLTRFEIDHCFKDYLNKIGFEFINKWVDGGEMPASESVFSLASKAFEKGNIKKSLLANDIRFEPYAVVQPAIDMCQRLGINYTFPNIEVIKKVNSKIYSTNLERLLTSKSRSIIVNNHSEILEAGKKLLENSAILVKDPYGVSGNGNLLINSEAILKRIARHIASQESKGYKTELLVEPLLNKKLDFSCEFNISPDGKYTFICVQNTINSGFAYMGSYTADRDFLEFLERKNYFYLMERVAQELYKEGYFGDACVDSMLLEDGEIVNIIEINPRKSMGFINYAIDKYLSGFELSGNFTYFSVGFSGNVDLHDIFSRMDKQGLLFKPERLKGVIPLSETALFINRKLDKEYNDSKVYKGRLYISAAGKTIEERKALIAETKELLLSLDFRIY